MKYAIIALAVAGAAHTAAASAPGWCKESGGEGAGFNMDEVRSKDAADALPAIAAASCGATGGNGPEVDAARAKWTKALGLTDADWIDLFAWNNTHRERFSGELGGHTLDELSAGDQFLAIAQPFKDDSHYEDTDALYVADALESRLTEIGRLAFVQWCIKGDEPAKWAVCQGDFDAFDAAKLSAQARGEARLPPAVRGYLRVQGYVVADKIRDIREREAKLVAADPAWKAVFDAAAAGRAAWKTAVGGNAKLLALAETTDSGVLFHSRRQLEGCEAKTAEAVATAVGALPASAFRGMHDDRSDPFKGFIDKAGPMLANVPAVNVALIAYIECQPKAALAVTMSQYVARIPSYRGPRSAALGAVIASNPKFDDSRTKLQPPNFGARPYQHDGGAAGSAGGAAKTVKKGSIALEKTTIKTEDCVAEHNTNQIARITDGRVEYVKVCDKAALVTHDVTWDDFDVEDGAEALVKPGNVFSATYGTRKSAILAVWPSKTSLLPSMVLGAKVK